MLGEEEVHSLRTQRPLLSLSRKSPLNSRTLHLATELSKEFLESNKICRILLNC